MPAFEGCPEEAERYRRDYVGYWDKAVRHNYEAMKKAVGSATDAKKIISMIDGIKEIKPPMKFDDKNDDSMARRHALGDAVDALRKYFKKEVEKSGRIPSLDGVLSNVKAEPKYASTSFSFG